MYPPKFAIFNEMKKFEEVDRLRLYDINDVRKKKQGKSMTFHSNIIIYGLLSRYFLCDFFRSRNSHDNGLLITVGAFSPETSKVDLLF